MMKMRKRNKGVKMADEYRVIIIDEENRDLLTNQLIDEEIAERMAAIVECGSEVEDGSEGEIAKGCERVCSQVASMLEDADINTDNHDEMIEELKDMVLVKLAKVKKPEKIKKIVEKKKDDVKTKLKIRKIRRN